MQFFRKLTTRAKSPRMGVRQEELTSVAPGQAWSSLSPLQEGHTQSARSDRQVHPTSRQHTAKSGCTSRIDLGCQKVDTSLQGLWELDDRNIDQRLVCDLDRRFIVFSDCVQNCEGECHPIVVNNVGTQFVLGDGFFALDSQHKTLRCTFASGHIRMYHRLLLPGTQAIRSLQGTWRAMSCKSKKKDPTWSHLTISGYCFEGVGPGKCRGFLQVKGGSLRASTSILCCTEDWLLVTTGAGRTVRYFRMRGAFKPEQIKE